MNHLPTAQWDSLMVKIVTKLSSVACGGRKFMPVVVVLLHLDGQEQMHTPEMLLQFDMLTVCTLIELWEKLAGS
jgi:hypothetical protein